MNWEEVNSRLCDAPVFIDTAFSIGEIAWQDMTGEKTFHQMSDEMFVKMVRTFGSEKVLFGTDCPWAGQKDYVDRMNAMDLTNEELENIYFRNASRLLGINL